MCSNRSSSNKILGDKDAVSMMKSLVLTMTKLIENRTAISDDWLILSFIFCDNFDLELKSKLILHYNIVLVNVSIQVFHQ